MSEGEGSLDRTTQVTGRHCRDGFYDQDEADMAEGGLGEFEVKLTETDRLRVRVRVRVRTIFE